MGHTMHLLAISVAMLVLLVIVGLTDPVLTFYPSKDAVRMFDIGARTQAKDDGPNLWNILSGIGDRRQ